MSDKPLDFPLAVLGGSRRSATAEELARRIARGDILAESEFLERYRETARAIARNSRHSGDFESQAVAQEVLDAVLARARSGELSDELSFNIAIAIATNDAYRRRSKSVDTFYKMSRVGNPSVADLASGAGLAIPGFEEFVNLSRDTHRSSIFANIDVIALESHQRMAKALAEVGRAQGWFEDSSAARPSFDAAQNIAQSLVSSGANQKRLDWELAGIFKLLADSQLQKGPLSSRLSIYAAALSALQLLAENTVDQPNAEQTPKSDGDPDAIFEFLTSSADSEAGAASAKPISPVATLSPSTTQPSLVDVDTADAPINLRTYSEPSGSMPTARVISPVSSAGSTAPIVICKTVALTSFEIPASIKACAVTELVTIKVNLQLGDDIDLVARQLIEGTCAPIPCMSTDQRNFPSDPDRTVLIGAFPSGAFRTVGAVMPGESGQMLMTPFSLWDLIDPESEADFVPSGSFTQELGLVGISLDDYERQ